MCLRFYGISFAQSFALSCRGTGLGMLVGFSAMSDILSVCCARPRFCFVASYFHNKTIAHFCPSKVCRLNRRYTVYVPPIDTHTSLGCTLAYGSERIFKGNGAKLKRITMESHRQFGRPLCFPQWIERWSRGVGGSEEDTRF